MAIPGMIYLDASNTTQRLVAARRTPTIESIRIALNIAASTI
jgi:hypothetical protein